MRVIVLSLMVLVLSLPVSQADILVCKKGCDFSSIQAAIDAAEEGETIVAEGFFFENLNISKPIILTGNPTLFPSGLKAGISISADNVEVSGFTIKGGITGIEVVNAEGVKIEKCNFDRNFYGVLLLQSSNCTVKGNNFEEINETAIRIEGSDSNTISSNHINDSTVAVHFLQSSWNNLTDSSFINVQAGVYLEESINNNIIGNEISAEEAIYMYQSGENRVSENIADGSFFIRLLFSSKNEIELNKANGIYENLKSQKNEFYFENIMLTGEEFHFSIVETKLPDGLIPLSEALNLTITPDLITETGYVEFNASVPLNELNVSTVGIYRVDEGMKKLSESYLDEETSMVKTNFTTDESGIYLLAGKKLPSPSPPTPTPIRTPTETPKTPWIPGFEFLSVVVGILMVLILRRRMGAK